MRRSGAAEDNRALVEAGAAFGALPDGGGDDASADAFLSNDVNVFGGEAVPRGKSRENVVNWYFDALENGVANHHDGVSFRLEHPACNAAKSVCVIEVTGGVVCPAGAAVGPTFDANGAYLSEQFLQLWVIELQRNEEEALLKEQLRQASLPVNEGESVIPRSTISDDRTRRPAL